LDSFWPDGDEEVVEEKVLSDAEAGESRPSHMGSGSIRGLGGPLVPELTSHPTQRITTYCIIFLYSGHLLAVLSDTQNF
jgi:hypothetical protein